MRLHRFIQPVALSPGVIRIKNADMLNQVKNVFRMSKGDKIILSDGKGREGTAEIISFYKDGVELSVSGISNIPTSNIKTTLYLAIIKKDNFELAVQKAVECGISAIVPVITKRTIKMNLNMDRLRKIALEASEQSGRAGAPNISEPVAFSEAVKNSSGLNIFFHMDGRTLAEIAIKNEPEVSGWVGPEGGWEDGELEMAKKAGFIIASLGKTTLRAETAAIIASYLISN